MTQEQTRAQFVEQLDDAQRKKPFEPYPKMLYHPDGGVLVVNGKIEEEQAFRGDWTPTPATGLKARQSRDEAVKKAAGDLALQKALTDNAMLRSALEAAPAAQAPDGRLDAALEEIELLKLQVAEGEQVKERMAALEARLTNVEKPADKKNGGK